MIWLILGMVVVVLLVGGVVLFLKRLNTQGEHTMRERFPNAKNIWVNELYVGQESRGKMQARGNGTLVLTEQELFFQGWLSKQGISIPLQQIQSLEIVNSHLGKSTLRDLVKVHI